MSQAQALVQRLRSVALLYPTPEVNSITSWFPPSDAVNDEIFEVLWKEVQYNLSVYLRKHVEVRMFFLFMSLYLETDK